MWKRSSQHHRNSMLRKVKANSKVAKRVSGLGIVEESVKMMVCSHIDCGNPATDGVSKCDQHRTCSLTGCFERALPKSRHCLRHLKESIIPPAYLKSWDVLRIVCDNKACGAITSVGCPPNSKLGIKVCPVCMSGQ